MTGGDQAPDCEISPFATAARLDLISATLSERSALTMAARATAVIAFMRKRLSRKFGPNKKKRLCDHRHSFRPIARYNLKNFAAIRRIRIIFRDH
jgi:hypothetical protein